MVGPLYLSMYGSFQPAIATGVTTRSKRPSADTDDTAGRIGAAGEKADALASRAKTVRHCVI